MEIVYTETQDGVGLFVDGEDTETMSVKKREWVLNAVVEQIDSRHFETVLTALVKEHGNPIFLNIGTMWQLNLENRE